MQKYDIFILLLLASSIALPAQEAAQKKFTSLEPYNFQLQYLKNDSSLLIDVREFFEYKKSRIKGAVNIPASGNMEFAADTLDKNLALFLYCTTGFRSSRVCEKLSGKGFRKIYNLEGGITAWKKEGRPIERHKVRR